MLTYGQIILLESVQSLIEWDSILSIFNATDDFSYVSDVFKRYNKNITYNEFYFAGFNVNRLPIRPYVYILQDSKKNINIVHHPHVDRIIFDYRISRITYNEATHKIGKYM